MPRPVYKRADALTRGDRIEFFRGETLSIKEGERNDPLTDTVSTVQTVEGGMVQVVTVSQHVLVKTPNCTFRLAAAETLDARPLAGKAKAQTVRGVSIE